MINRDVLGQIIADFKENSLPDLIPRKLKVDLDIPIKRAITIMGPRRSGKTYYLYSLIKELLNQGIGKERILYINFENPRLAGMDLNDLLVLMEVFYEIYPQNKKDAVWLFFDEIQNIKGWENFIRDILDKENVKVFLSGSSSKLLSKEIATSLRGRTLSYLMLPFSFSEFLGAKKIDYSGKYLASEQKGLIVNAFLDYFNFGGYPEVVFYPEEKTKIIQEIIEVTIYKDLIERYKIRNTKVIKLMFNYLIKAKEFSVNKFYNFLQSMNIKIGRNSLYNYLELYNDAFIFFPLKKFSYSLKKIEQSSAKIYTIDNALISEIIGDDMGKKLENLVFLAILGQGFKINQDFFYYEDGKEIDFVFKEKDGSIKEMLQVCYDINSFDTKEREIKALLKCGETLKCENMSVITFDYEAEEKIEGKTIKFIPAWKWLLEKC